MTAPRIAVALVLLVAAMIGPRTELALGKQAKRGTSGARKAAPAAPGRAPKEKGTAAPAKDSNRDDGREGSADEAGTSETAVAPAPTGGGKVKTKTYTFGAMDVEGKLKTPQLLYFLNRVKLELDMSAPDRRSFMKELQQSADDKNL
jgi:hypothetical protein